MFNKIRYILTFLIVSLIIIFFNNTAYSQVVINEIMSGPNTDGLDFNVSSTNANSLYNFLPDDQPPYNREWIELYNMNPCDSADISCYMLGCNEYDKSSDQPNWGVFIFPQGTKIPPMGYIVIGGNASQVKKIDFNLHDYINTPYLDGFPDRWFLRDAYGWLALYNPSGNVVDAVFWSQGDNPPYSTGKATDILKHSEYSSPITTSKSCSGDITLESALQLYKENKIAFLGNSATGQFATFQRKTDGNIAWYPNSATPTPNANNYKPSSISVSSVNSTCFNSNNGTATVNYNNAPYGLNYTYIWDDPKSQNTKTATNLSPGTYKASIKFTNYSCSFVSTPVTITEPTQLTANISMQDATCGNNNGTATISPSGGTPGYTYTWSNGKTTGSVIGLSGGNYTVTVYDKNKCSVIKSLTINSTNNLQLTVTTTQNSCNGDASGTASVAVVGGSTPYKYSWSTGDTVSKISRLIKGTYSIYITDFKGCKKDTSVIINDPPKLTITQLIKTDILCNGNNTGSIKTTITGGTTPYTYIWSNGKTSADLSNLTAGNYQVTVTDNKGCKTTSVIVNINQPTALKNSISKTDNKCGKSNGSVTLTVTGGTTPYTYTWSNGSKTQNLSNIPAETYTVTIKDNNGCSDLKSITIVSGSDLTVSSPSKTDITCFGKNDGTARAIASGGTLPYTFLWSDKESAATITSLQTGAYTLTVTDAFGCSGTNSVVINQPADILITPSQTNILCNGNKSGAVNIIVTGGTIPYTYLWSNSKTTQNISGLGSGNYSITVTDANSCTKVHSTTITEPSKLSVKIDSTNTTCGFNNGTAKANVTGGTSPYNYLWSNNSTNQNINNLPAGNYKLTVTDKNACSATQKTDIALSSALTLSNPRVINPTCKYANNGSITVFASNGTLPYTYSWSNGEDSSTILNLIPGNYLVTVTDKIGCTGTSQATITEPSKLSVSSINKTDAMCYEEVSGSINITASGGTSPYTYTWSNGSTQNSLSRLKAGDYTVTITDSKECDTIFTVQITQPPAINSSITHSDTKCSLNNGTITVNASGGTPPISYLWSNKSTNNFISGLKAGIYSVTITDGNSCHKILSDTVNSSTNVSIKFTKANITCYGFNNGTANAIVTGGTQSYTYKWSNGKNTSLINNLKSGQYYLTVTDADGCKTDSSIYINDVNKLTDS
ncbi:MAG: lamin tail domain-containing protein, partial [Bacteroidota bacterium]|nr:lamin tail domain-containing protein [Bacteroidota bacterium]